MPIETTLTVNLPTQDHSSQAQTIQPAPIATRIAVELVARSRSGLRAELEEVRSLGSVQTVNIPDLLRYSMRSWQGCTLAQDAVPCTVPHIRAIDINPLLPLPMAGALDAAGITEVLVIEGDAPADMSHRTYPVTSLEIIRKFRREMPHVTVWAGLDPYRQNYARERDYVEAKLEAGAAGVFTQPFFDLRMVELWAELLPACQVFWGATTITTEASLSYWRNRNKAVFPRGFEPTLEWQRQFAAELLAFARQTGSHAYFMPVRASVSEYLSGVL